MCPELNPTAGSCYCQYETGGFAVIARTILNVREAISRLGCTRTYIYDLLCEGKLPGAQKKGREWRIPLAAIEQRLKEREARNG